MTSKTIIITKKFYMIEFFNKIYADADCVLLVWRDMQEVVKEVIYGVCLVTAFC